jgi:hypothetical protein
VQVTLSGNRGEFIEAIKQKFYEISPEVGANKKTYANKLGKAISKNMGDIQHAKFDTWINEDLVKQISLKNLNAQEAADEMVKKLSKAGDIEKISLGAFTKKMDEMKTIRGKASAGAAVLGGILMVYNFTKVVEDMKSSYITSDKIQAWTRLVTGFVGFVGLLGDGLGQVLEKI